MKKKLLALIFACGLLVGCQTNTPAIEGNATSETNQTSVESEKANDDSDWEFKTENEFSLYDTITGKIISLGMTKTEIAEILNEDFVDDEVNDSFSPRFSDIDGLKVGFRDGVAVIFALGGSYSDDHEAIKRFMTSRKIQLGASTESFMEAYPTAIADQPNNMFFYALKEGDNYRDVSSVFEDLTREEKDAVFVIHYGSVSIDMDEKPDTLWISERRAMLKFDFQAE